MAELKTLIKKHQESLLTTQKLRKEIDNYYRDEKISKLNKFVGKYYQEKYPDEDYISCVFNYNVDLENCKLNSLIIRYWRNNPNELTIETYKYWEFDDEWFEISKEDFMKHYVYLITGINIIIDK